MKSFIWRVFPLLLLSVFWAKSHPYDSTRNLVISGHDAPLDRYPYIVKIHTSIASTRPVCSGTLVAPDMVLTAAHCGEGNVVRVTAGYNTADPDDHEDITVDYEIAHPLRQTLSAKSHDVALLKLTAASVHPTIKLNRQPEIPSTDQELRLVGWGRVDLTAAQAAEKLQVLTNVTYVPPEQCKPRYGNGLNNVNVITPDTLCAIGFNHSGGCRGDSGGPLFLPGPTYEDDVQVGIVSFSDIRCTFLLKPDVYARVSEVYSWIESTVCRHSSALLASSNFDCSEYSSLDTVSPQPIWLAPSASPSISTVSQAPSNEVAPVLLELHPGHFASHVGWQISPAGQPHKVVAYVAAGQYTRSYGLVMEQIDALLPETDYELIVIDKHHIGGIGGYVSVYLGTYPSSDALLAYADLSRLPDIDKVTIGFRTSPSSIIGFPTVFPSISPSLVPSGPSISPAPTDRQIMIFIQITTDLRPMNTGWCITNNRTGEVLKEVPPLTYRLETTQYTEWVVADEGEIYSFEVVTETDFEGQVLIVAGDTLSEDALVGYMEGWTLDYGNYVVNFLASLDATVRVYPTMSPTVSPQPSFLTVSPEPTHLTVSVRIMISPAGRNPQVSFILRDPQDGEIALETPFSFLPSSGTDFELELKHETTYEMTIAFRTGGEFEGTITVYLGVSPSVNRVLAVYNGTGDSFNFTTSENNFISVSTPSPTPQEFSMTPSSSPLPEGYDYVFVRIVLDKGYEGETSWDVLTAAGERVSFGRSCGECTEWTKVLVLDRHNEYKLRLRDLYGDGLQNEAFVYFGTAPDEGNILLHYKYPDDFFSFVWERTFLTNTTVDGQIVRLPTQPPSSAPVAPTTAPSSSPSTAFPSMIPTTRAPSTTGSREPSESSGESDLLGGNMIVTAMPTTSATTAATQPIDQPVTSSESSAIPVWSNNKNHCIAALVTCLLWTILPI